MRLENFEHYHPADGFLGSLTPFIKWIFSAIGQWNGGNAYGSK
jgi:hypothetical protein